MIPNIEKGSSFRGAGAYYLHDKALDASIDKALKPSTTERVLWHETRNCVHDSPAEALDEMWHTYQIADQLKALAGVRKGRPITQPVKTISLSWHPEETPDRAAMTAAADAYLATMGWAEHQALLVAHSDTAHSHVHIIMNTVHPETGRVCNASNEQLRSQKWATDYEKQTGHIWCVDRADKYDPQRDASQKVRDKPGRPQFAEAPVKASVAAFTAADVSLEQRDKAERGQLGERHKAERDHFFDQRKTFVKALRTEVYARVREEWRDTWREHHERVKADTITAAGFCPLFNDAAVEAVQAGRLAEAATTLQLRDKFLGEVAASHAAQSAALHSAQKTETKERQNEAAAAFINERYSDYQALLDRQKSERAEVRKLQAKRDDEQPHDAARLAALIAPFAPTIDTTATQQQRITQILDRLQASADGTDERSAMDDPRKRELQDATTAMQRRMADKEIEEQHAQHLKLIDDLKAQQQRDHDMRQQQDRDKQRNEAEDKARSDRDATRDEFLRDQANTATAAREAIDLAKQREANDREAQARATSAYNRDPKDRAAEALGLMYNKDDPYTSLARAAGYEHALFKQDMAQMQERIAAATNDNDRRLFQMQADVTRFAYCEHICNRNAAMSELITGRSAETSEQRAERHAKLDPAMREAVQKAERADRVSEAQREQTMGIQGNAQARLERDHASKWASFRATTEQNLHLHRVQMEKEQIERTLPDSARAIAERTMNKGTAGLASFQAKMAADRERAEQGFMRATREPSRSRESEALKATTDRQQAKPAVPEHVQNGGRRL